MGAGIATEVDLTLHCKGAEEFGGARVNGKINICAEIQTLIVKPLQTAKYCDDEWSANAGVLPPECLVTLSVR